MRAFAKIPMALLAAMLLIANFAGAQQTDLESVPDDLEQYYNEHIDMKIQAARKRASWVNEGDRDLKCMAEVAQMEKEFYKDNRKKLIQEMYSREIGKEGMKDEDMYNVHYFLINAFHRAHPETMTKCLNIEEKRQY